MLPFEGIIIKSMPYLEQAKIVTMLTPSGKERFIIRGANKIKSKNRVISQVLMRLSFQTTTKGSLKTLTESEILDGYDAIKDDYDKMQSVFPILEKCDHFAEQVTDTQVFYSFVKSMLELLKNSPYHHSLRNLFELKLTYLLGIGPHFASCTSCGKEDGLQFIPQEGGVLCPNCIKPSMISTSAQMTQLVKYLYLIKVEKITNEFLATVDPFANEIEELIDLYYVEFLGFTSMSKKIVKQMNK